MKEGDTTKRSKPVIILIISLIIICIPVFADQTTTVDTDSDNFKTLVKTDAYGAEFVVAIPQEITMERDADDFTKYYSDYTVKVKGVLPKGAYISVKPVSSFDITTAAQTFSAKVFVTQPIVNFYVKGTDKSSLPDNSIVLENASDYTRTTGTITSTIPNPGKYSGYMGFTVELHQ